MSSMGVCIAINVIDTTIDNIAAWLWIRALSRNSVFCTSISLKKISTDHNRAVKNTAKSRICTQNSEANVTNFL